MSVLGINPPNLEDLQRYSVNQPDALEIIYEPLFDFQVYPAAGTPSLKFFQQQVGSGGKNFEDTNMQGNGFMPNPQLFMITGLAVEFYTPAVPGRVNAANTSTNWNDFNALHKTGRLQIIVGDKPYLTQAPIGMFPPSYRLAGMSALTGVGAGAVIDGVDYAVMAGQQFKITPITLPPMQNFSVNLDWATLVPVTAESRIGVRMFGFRYRAVQ